MSFLPARNNIATRVYFHILSAYSHVLSGSSTPKNIKKHLHEKTPLFQLPSGAIKFPLYAKYCLWPLVFHVAPIFSSSSKLFFWVALDFPPSMSVATGFPSIYYGPQMFRARAYGLVWPQNWDLIFGNYTMSLYRLSILPRPGCRKNSSETTTGRTDGHKFSQNSIVC